MTKQLCCCCCTICTDPAHSPLHGCLVWETVTKQAQQRQVLPHPQNAAMPYEAVLTEITLLPCLFKKTIHKQTESLCKPLWETGSNASLQSKQPAFHICTCSPKLLSVSTGKTHRKEQGFPKSLPWKWALFLSFLFFKSRPSPSLHVMFQMDREGKEANPVPVAHCRPHLTVSNSCRVRPHSSASLQHHVWGL